jgi:choline dehydrogenase-like flavoprotein
MAVRMDYVIGSGPSGVACAVALLRRGRQVTMLDAGGELEEERQRQVEQLRGMDPAQWRSPAIDFMTAGMSADRKGVGVKRVFGSDYPYRDAERFMPLEKVGVDTRSSLAVGGFSAVWGAAILPFRQEDMAGWPIGVADLAPHYQAILSFMDASGVEDDLAEWFPLYTDARETFDRSRQADALFRDLERNREALKRAGIRFGSARLAARPRAKGGRPGCVYCGLCLYGCPYGLIYSTTETFQYLASFPNFHRISGVIVEQLQEGSSQTVSIIGRGRQTGAPVEFQADRVFLAAGVLVSTRILLESMKAYDRQVTLKNSQYFLLPILRYANVRGVSEERLHTLAQAFIEIHDPSVSRNTVHLQVYTYNDLYVSALKKTFAWTAPLLRPALGSILGRMLTVQGYLHSDCSPEIGVTLARGPEGSNLLRLEVQPEKVAEADAVLRRVLRKLSDNSRSLRARPVGRLLIKPAAGHGFHVGGTFPMRTHPAGFESDMLGRPAGFSRVHLVDSSVLPTIPATTITFSVMANAHRIGSLAP